MRMILTLIGKDFRVFWADKAAVVVTFAVPMVLIVIFGFVFGGGDDGPSGVRVLVVDQAQSSASQTLIEALREADGLSVSTHYEAGKDNAAALRPLTEEIVRERLESNASTWRFAMIFPPDFQKEGFGFRLVYLYNPRSATEHQVVMGLLQRTFFSKAFPILQETLAEDVRAQMPVGAIARFQTDISRAISKVSDVSEAEILSTFPEGSLFPDFGAINPGKAAEGSDNEGGAAENDPLSFLLELDEEQIAGRGKKPEAQSVGGWAVMFLLFTMTGAASALFEERDNAVFHRLLAGPVSRGHILGSKFGFLVMLGFCQLTVLFLFGQLLFGVVESVEQLLPLVVVGLVGTAAATSFGMILSAISKSPAQASGLGTLFILSMSALGGAMFPSFMLPAIIRDYLSKGTLVHWMMDGFLQVLWEDAPLAALWPNLVILFGTAVIMLSIALVLFRRGDLFR